MTTAAAEDETLDVGTLPEVIPLFPLPGVLLLPRAHLPLNIFEPRYLAMTRDALASESVIGMVQPRDADDSRFEPPIYDTGCLGRIVDHRETPDGRILITLSGLARFDIVEELARTTPYRKALVSYDRFAVDGEAPQRLAGGDRARLEATLKDYLAARGLDADWAALVTAPDERLVNAMAMIYPFDAGEKLALLEAGDLAARAQTMTTLMEFALCERGDPTAGPH